jgi:hypothetical protein
MYAYIASSHLGVSILDTSQPEHPAVIGTVSTGGNFVDQVAVSDGLAFLGFYEGGLRLIDATRPRSPLLRGSYPSYSIDIQIVGDIVYFIGRDGSLQILRVKPSGFTNPVFVRLAYH